MSGIGKLATAFVAAGLLSSSASATETLAYTYDVHGRLVQVVHTGTVNPTAQTSYTYDTADNRTHKTTTGAP